MLTHEVGSLEGVVTDERGQPLPDAAVIIFKDDPSRWFAGSPAIMLSRTISAIRGSTSSAPVVAQTPGPATPPRTQRQTGSFVSPVLLPGRYLVVALEVGSQMPPQDRESLEKLRQHAVIATVTAGATATVQLRALKSF